MAKKYKVKLGIGLPLTDIYVFSYFFYSFVNILSQYMVSLANKNEKINIEILIPDFPSKRIDVIRNNIVLKALNEGCTHLLFMDTDQIYMTSNLVEKMLAHNKPVVGAKVHRRYFPYDPLLFRGKIGSLYAVPDNEIMDSSGVFNDEVKVDATGSGCILCDTRIFIDMLPDKKWFVSKKGPKGEVGEDIAFCEKLKKYDVPIIVDASIDIRHLFLMSADWDLYKLTKKVYKIKEKEKNDG